MNLFPLRYALKSTLRHKFCLAPSIFLTQRLLQYMYTNYCKRKMREDIVGIYVTSAS
jgi:hypothetical protein